MYGLLLVATLLVCLFVATNNNNSFFEIRPSKIHGVGVFTRKQFFTGEAVLKAIELSQEITYLGKHVNHSNNPNTVLKLQNDGWYLLALRNINPNEEITADYKDTPPFIKKPDPNWK
uniref:SET domain-containing protein n=1 Tax=viral metagenome TaxID=1070528 RepID=A0A6C0ECG5_9ZZZZ